MPLITTVSPEQTHFNAYQSCHCEESHCLGHCDLNKMCELWVTVTGHSQVIVTLVWANNPTFSGFLTQNLALIWFNRLKSRAIGSCMATTTLHTSSIPLWGLHMLFFTRKDRYHTLLLLLVLTGHLYPSHQFCFFHFPFCFWAQHFVQPGNYPRMSVLRCPASAHHDHTQPYINCINLDHITINGLFCM